MTGVNVMGYDLEEVRKEINTPNMSTVLKLLAEFGKTLYIGNMKNVKLEEGADTAAANENLTTE